MVVFEYLCVFLRHPVHYNEKVCIVYSFDSVSRMSCVGFHQTEVSDTKIGD